MSSDLWSARILLEDPDEVRAAHAEFFAAGAQVATTASYQVSYEGLAAVGRDAAETDEVLARSVRLAAEARDDAPHGGWVAASVGPYGATLGDGSEYRGDDGLTVPELRAWHRRRLRVLADAGPDVLAIETITRLAEIEALAAELDGIGVPAWISLTISDGALRTGESLREAFTLAAVDGVVALGVNCCDASEVSTALGVARAVAEPAHAGLPEQRRGLGRREPGMDRHIPAPGRSGARVGVRRRDPGRRLLPHRPGGNRRDRPARRCERRPMTGDATYRGLSFWHDSLPEGSLAPRAALGGTALSTRRMQTWRSSAAA